MALKKKLTQSKRDGSMLTDDYEVYLDVDDVQSSPVLIFLR